MGSYWSNVIERGLIPPDEPETTECESERSEHLTRRVFKDGHIEWQRSEHDPDGYEQDVLEEAYDLGRQSVYSQERDLRRRLDVALAQLTDAHTRIGEAWGAGVVAAAQAAYGGKGR